MCGTDVSPQGPPVPAYEVSAAAVTAVAPFLTGPHSSLLCRCDYGFELLPFLLMDPLDLLPLLLH